jgi:DNA-binding transcriptional MerR regulator
MTEPAQLPISAKLLTLKQAAEVLDVSVETLLEWNNNNILKPTITTSGEVVYKQEQINKFLAIQKQTEGASATPLEQQNDRPKTPPQPNVVQSKVSVDHKINDQLVKNKDSKLMVLGVFASIFVLAIISLVTLFANQNKSSIATNTEVLSPSKEKDTVGTVSQQDTSGVALLKSSSSNEASPLTNKSIINNIDDTNTNTQDNKLAGDYLNNNHSASNAANVNQQVPLPPVLGLNTNGATTDFASRPNTLDGNSSIFDDKGNIKEDAVTPDTLATTLSSSGLENNGTQFKQTLYPTLLALGLFFIIFIFAAQPSFVTEKVVPTSTVPPNTSTDSQIQKVLEINQKPDGSVVLFFQGEEHKVSKPELNSETDQFIQRLMSFATNDVQEINYNILKDNKVRLNAPLSKLVTRLGFVGLKRDLFFPRTSKNRVIFRRYLTHQDLLSLGLTPNRISEELLN